MHFEGLSGQELGILNPDFAKSNRLPTSLLNSQTKLERAGLWFLSSGIQEPSGGVARYYKSEEKANAPLSTEITGYAVSAFLELYGRTKGPEYLEAAERAGDYLIGTAWRPELNLFPYETASHGADLVYFFDTGIIIRGLLRLWRVTGRGEFLEISKRAGRAMAQMFEAERGYYCIVRLPERSPLPVEPWWSRTPGCFHLKAALAWRELAELTGEAVFAEHYQRQLAFSLEVWRELLAVETDSERVMDRLHPLCYFLEGLLPVLDREEARAAMREGIEVCGRRLREIAPRFVRSDVYAQLLRARLFAEAAGVLPLDVPAAREEFERLEEFQDETETARWSGGFWFGRKAGAVMPFSNPVSTAFGLQAAAYWHERKAGAFRADWRDLI